VALVDVAPRWPSELDAVDDAWHQLSFRDRFHARQRLGLGAAWRVAGVEERWHSVRMSRAFVYATLGAPGNRIEIARRFGWYARSPDGEQTKGGGSAQQVAALREAMEHSERGRRMR
jgi:hypothetical protein